MGWVARIDYGNHDPSRIARVEHPIGGRSSNSASLPREPVKDYEAAHGRSAGSWRYEVARTCFDKNTELPSPDYDMNEPPSNWNWRMSSTYLDDILLQASSEILNRVHTTSSKRVSWYDEANNNIGDTDTETLKHDSSSTPSTIPPSSNPATSIKYHINGDQGKSLEEALKDFEYFKHF